MQTILLVSFCLPLFGSLHLEDLRKEGKDTASYNKLYDAYADDLYAYLENPTETKRETLHKQERTFDELFAAHTTASNSLYFSHEIRNYLDTVDTLHRSYNAREKQLEQLRNLAPEDSVEASLKVYRQLKDVPLPEDAELSKGLKTLLNDYELDKLTGALVSHQTLIEKRYKELTNVKEEVILDLIKGASTKDEDTILLLTKLLEK